LDNLANSINLDCIPVADPNEINILRVEYDNFITLQARVDTVKNYIEKESYPSVDVIKIMLGIDKTS